MKLKPTLFVFAVLCIVACSTADNKVPQMATDFCNCFRTMEDSLSSEVKQLLTTASNASDPEKAMDEATEGMSEEKKLSIGMEMMSFQSVEDPNSAVSRCMKDIENKYKHDRTTDKEKFAKKLIAELEKKQGCEVTAAIMKLGYKKEFPK